MFAKRNCVWLAGLALGVLATTPADAWAYVDPGTGSYVFQIAVAGFFAGMFTLRRCWDAVRARFGGETTIAARASQTADLDQ